MPFFTSTPKSDSGPVRRSSLNYTPLTREQARKILASPYKTGYTYAYSSTYNSSYPTEYIHPNFVGDYEYSNTSSISEESFVNNFYDGFMRTVLLLIQFIVTIIKYIWYGIKYLFIYFTPLAPVYIAYTKGQDILSYIGIGLNFGKRAIIIGYECVKDLMMNTGYMVNNLRKDFISAVWSLLGYDYNEQQHMEDVQYEGRITRSHHHHEFVSRHETVTRTRMQRLWDSLIYIATFGYYPEHLAGAGVAPPPRTHRTRQAKKSLIISWLLTIVGTIYYVVSGQFLFKNLQPAQQRGVMTRRRQHELEEQRKKWNWIWWFLAGVLLALLVYYVFGLVRSTFKVPKEEVRQINVDDNTGSVVDSVYDTAGSAYSSTVDKASFLGNKINNGFSWIYSKFVGMFFWFYSSISDIFSTIISFPKNVINWISNGISKIFYIIVDGFSYLFTGKNKESGNIFNRIGNVLQKIFYVAVDGISTVISSIGNGATKIFHAIGSGIQKIFYVLVDTVSSLFSGIFNGILSIGSGIIEGILNVFYGLSSGVQKVFYSIVDGITTIFYSFGNGIQKVFYVIVDGVSNIFTGISNSTTAVYHDVTKGGKRVAHGTGTGLQKLFYVFVDIVTNMITGAGNVILGFVHYIADGFHMIGSGVVNFISWILNGILNLMHLIFNSIYNAIYYCYLTLGNGIVFISSKLHLPSVKQSTSTMDKHYGEPQTVITDVTDNTVKHLEKVIHEMFEKEREKIREEKEKLNQWLLKTESEKSTIIKDEKSSKLNPEEIDILVQNAISKMNFSAIIQDVVKYHVETHNNNNNNNININQEFIDKHVHTIIYEGIKKYMYDKTGEPDFALESSGGFVVSTRCTENYDAHTRRESIFGIPLWYTSYSPRSVIQRQSQHLNAGECWAIKGDKAYLVIQLARKIDVTAVSYEHLPRELSVQGNINSAPKDFKIWSLQSEHDPDKFLIGEYRYDDEGEPLQRFSAKNQDPRGTIMVEFEVESNYGEVFTCLYRFRVHGNPIN